MREGWLSPVVVLVAILLGLALPQKIQAAVLTLDGCLSLVRSHNATLQSAAMVPGQARSRAREAHSVLLPHVDLDVGYTMQQQPQRVVMGAMTEATQQRDYSHLSLQAEQLIYDFGRSSGQVAAAEAGAHAASSQYAALEQDIFLQSVVAYYRVLTDEHILTAADDEVERMQAHLRVAQAMYDAGSVTRNDVLQAQVRLAASKQQQLAVQGSLRNSWLQLNYLLGRPGQSHCELSAQLPGDKEQLPDAAAVLKRPQLVAQRQLVEAARQHLRQVRGEYWPRLYARAGADYVDNSHVKEQTIYAATLGLRMKLYDGAARRAKVATQQRELRRQQLHLQDMIEQAQLEYRRARNDADVAAQRIAVAQVAIEQARENLRINNNRYQAQVGTATEVIDAQTLLTRTQTELYQAQYRYQVAIARVRRAVGTL